MIINVGYKFDKAAKSWKAAFMIAGSPAALADDNGEKHYELLDLEQLRARETEAKQKGDLETYAAYDVAEDAIEDTVEGRRATPYDLPEDFDAKLFSVAPDGEMFKVIDPKGDVDWTEFTVAQKTAKVKAEKVPPGTVVETIMASGHVETKKTAGPDGGYRVTNPAGEQYLVDTAKFESIYDETEVEGVYAPRPDPRKVLPLDQNVAFTAPWGEEMKIHKDGVLVYGGPKDVYGIQPEEFKGTYSPV